LLFMSLKKYDKVTFLFIVKKGSGIQL